MTEPKRPPPSWTAILRRMTREERLRAFVLVLRRIAQLRARGIYHHYGRPVVGQYRKKRRKKEGK